MLQPSILTQQRKCHVSISISYLSVVAPRSANKYMKMMYEEESRYRTHPAKSLAFLARGKIHLRVSYAFVVFSAVCG